MLEKSFLCGFAVIWRDRKNGINAIKIGILNGFYQGKRIISTHSNYDLQTTGILLNDKTNDFLLFNIRKGRGFACSSKHYQIIDSALNLILN